MSRTSIRTKLPNYTINATIAMVAMASWAANYFANFSNIITLLAGIMTIGGIGVAFRLKGNLNRLDTENSCSDLDQDIADLPETDVTDTFRDREEKGKEQPSDLSLLTRQHGVLVPNIVSSLDANDRYWNEIAIMDQLMSNRHGERATDDFGTVLNVVHHIIYHNQAGQLAGHGGEKVIVRLLGDDDDQELVRPA